MSVVHVISRRLKALRLEKGMSQRQLGQKTGFQERFLSQIENKPRHISTKTLERLALGLGVHATELLKEEDSKEEFEAKLPKKLAPGIDESIRLLRILRARIGKLG